MKNRLVILFGAVVLGFLSYFISERHLQDKESITDKVATQLNKHNPITSAQPDALNSFKSDFVEVAPVVNNKSNKVDIEASLKNAVSQTIHGERKPTSRLLDEKLSELKRLDEQLSSTSETNYTVNNAGNISGIYPSYTQTFSDADEFLVVAANLIDISDKSHLNKTKTECFDTGNCVSRYERTAYGYPVLQDNLVVSLNDGKVISAMGAMSLPNINPEHLKNSDVISVHDIKQLLQSEFGKQYLLEGDVVYGIYDAKTSAIPAYQATIKNGVNGYDVIINARNKQVVNKVNHLKHVNAQGQDLQGNTYQFQAQEDNSRYVMKDNRYPVNSFTGILDLEGLTKDEWNTNRPLNLIDSDNLTSGWDPSAVSVLSHFDSLVTYFDTSLNYQVKVPGDQPMLIFVNMREENAFAGSSEMFFGKTDVSNYANSRDVVAHELTHSIINATSNLTYSFQSGALNESFADLFGILAADDGNWLLGEDIREDGSYLRNMKNPSDEATYKFTPIGAPQPSHMNEFQNLSIYSDNGGVHINSGIPNRFFYLLAEGNVNNPIGLAKTGRIAFNVLTTLNSNATFADFYQAMKAQARALYGDGSGEFLGVIESGEGVGFTSAGVSKTESQTNQISASVNATFFLNYNNLFDTYNLNMQTYNSDSRVYNADNVIVLTQFANASRPTAGVYDNGTESELSVLYKALDDSIGYIFYNSKDGYGNSTFLNSDDAQNLNKMSIDRQFRNIAYSLTGTLQGNIALQNLSDKSFEFIHPATPSFTKDDSGVPVELIDVVEFDPTGRFLAFDYLTSSLDGGTYWSIGILELDTGFINYPFAKLPSNISVGNPVFSNVNSDIIIFDALFEDTGESAAFSLNLNNGDISGIANTDFIDSGTHLAYPSFTQNDNAIVFNFKVSSDFGDIYLASTGLDGDYKAIANSSKYLNPVDTALYSRTIPIDIYENTLTLRQDETTYEFGDVVADQIDEICLTNESTHPIKINNITIDEGLILSALPNNFQGGEKVCAPFVIKIQNISEGQFNLGAELFHNGSNAPILLTFKGNKLADFDKDGIPDTTDNDDDNDGVLDTVDAYPLIAIGNLTDTDGDGAPDTCDEACVELGMAADTDDDNDGVLDTTDAYPLIAIGDLTDTDLDGSPDTCDEACVALGMTADTDDDNDGVLDIAPVITLTGSATVTHALGVVYTDAGATASDAVDGEVSVTASGTVNVNVVGTYTLTYSAVDSAGNTSTSVTRTVNVFDGANPEVFDLHRATEKNTPTTFALIGRDADGDELTYSIVTEPNSGSVSISGDMVTYTPKSNLNYSETFTYKATDGVNDSATSTVTMTVFAGYHNVMQQLGQDIDGEAKGDRSGIVSLSADGQTVAIGTGISDRRAHVRIYSLIGDEWQQIGQNIDGEGEQDRSAVVSLSANGQTVAIGAGSNDGNGFNSGHVRVYSLIGDEWQQIGQDIDGEAERDYSGSFISINADGRTVAIGALHNDGNGNDSGHVRVYSLIGDEWQQIGQDIDGEAKGDRSGIVSLSADGQTVAIGAASNDVNGAYSGHVRVYTFTGDTWQQLGQDIDSEEEGEEYGKSISLSADGQTVAIAARLKNGNGNQSGQVRIYSLIGDEWQQIGKDINGETAYDRSGDSVSLSADGRTVAIGASNNDGNGNNSGHVRVYSLIGDEWQQIGQDIDGEAERNYSGYSVSISADGQIVSIGAYLNNDGGTDSGHVRIYDLTDLDSDFDGVINSLDLFPFISILGFTDSDNDGAPDTCGEICVKTGMEADTDDDGDGLSDSKELAINLDPLNSDSDNDGVLDGDEQVSFELISTFPELAFNMHRIDESLSIQDAYIRLVAPSQCYVETGFNDKSDDQAQLSIPLHENAISGDYQISILSAGISEKLSFIINNPEQDITTPMVTGYDISANASSETVEVLLQISGMDNGFGVDDPWINSTRLTNNVYVGDAPSNYVGSVSYLEDVMLKDDIYEIRTAHDLSGLALLYKEAPTINYVRICEQSYNGVEYTVDIDGDNTVDEFDIAPNNPAVWIDVDKDLLDNSIDNCPLIQNPEQEDFDADGVGNVCDDDDDNDGLNDDLDAFPLNSSEQTDSDGDGLGDNYELFNDLDRLNPDFDADGLEDGAEIEVGTNPKLADSDDDGVIDGKDKFPLISIGELLDTDGDGAPDECDEVCLALGMTADRDGIPAYTYIESDSFAFASLTPTAKIIVTGSQGGNFFDIARYVNEVSVVGQTFLFSGSSEVDGVMIQPGVKYDLTNLKGSIDKLYFSGPLSEYADSILLDTATGVMQLSRLTDIGEEIVQFIATASAADELVFTDGAISTADIKAAVTSGTPLADLTLDTTSKVLDDKTTTGATVKHIVLDNNGAGVMALGPNISTLISGNSGIDQIYVPAGSNVDASNLKSSQDEIYLQGNLADYTSEFDSSGNIVLSRDVVVDDESQSERVVLASGGNAATNDLVIFKDRQIETATLKQQVLN
jgi:Zn-dependent metalloprotease